MWWPDVSTTSQRRGFAALALACALFLGACGYQPLYGSRVENAAVPEFAAIAIEQPETRTAQVIRNHLLDMLTPLGAPERPLYRLQMKVTENVSSVLVTRADEITRSNLKMTVQYTLVDYRSGAALVSHTISSTTSFNVLRTDYANLVGERDARARAARDAAEQIRIRLGNYFTRSAAQRQSRP